MEPSTTRFTCLTNQSVPLDRTAELCLQPAIFLSRAFFGRESVKVYRIDSKHDIHQDLQPKDQPSKIHTFCTCILSAIVLIPATFLGGLLKGWSWCTNQHKEDCKQLHKFLNPEKVKDPNKKPTHEENTLINQDTGNHLESLSSGQIASQGEHNGDVYEGAFAKGYRTGQGKLTKTNGDVYEGEFVKDKLSGFGVYIWKKGGQRYQGAFKENEPSGVGKLFDKEGTLLYEGEFERGLPKEPSKQYLMWDED